MRWVPAAAVLVAAACHSAKRAPVSVAPPVAPAAPPPADAGAAPDTAARAEAAWARREADPAALDEAISLWEEAAVRSVDPSALLLDAARARRLRVLRSGRTGDSDAAASAADAQGCATDAHRSWGAQFPAAAAQVDGKHEAVEVFALVGPAAAEALYLDAVCGGAWARLQGFTPLIERRGELTAALRRVAQLAPELDGGGPERELGMLLAALPAYAGGDLDEARKQLEAAVARAPGDARNRLGLARTVAVKAQDRALFEEQLRLVTKGDDAVASADAAALLEREEELFGPR